MAVQITFQAVSNTQTAADFNIGTYGQTPDGREWSYVQASTGGLAKGSAAVPVANTTQTLCSSSTDAMGRIVYITHASAGWTAGAFENAWVIVQTGTGVGQAGRISGNTTDTLQLYPEFAFGTALAVADSGITITQNFTVVKSAITSKLQNAVGVAQVAFSAGDYGWLLTKGEGVVIADEVLTPVGTSFVTGGDETGSVLKGTTAKGPFDEQSLGRVLVVNATENDLTQVWVEV